MRKAALVLCGLLVVLSLASSLVTQAQEALRKLPRANCWTRTRHSHRRQRTNNTLKTDAGTELSVTVSDTTRLLQLKPGEKDLKAAHALALADLKAGDACSFAEPPAPMENLCKRLPSSL